MTVKSDIGPFSVVPEWVLDAPVSDRAVRLFAVLGRYADKKGESHPSRSTLAARLRCSVDSLDRAAKELVANGMLEVKRRRVETGRHLTSVYILHVAARTRRGDRTDAASGSRVDAAQNETHLNENPPYPPGKRGEKISRANGNTPRQLRKQVEAAAAWNKRVEAGRRKYAALIDAGYSGADLEKELRFRCPEVADEVLSA